MIVSRRPKPGLTIVELLVVISLIGMLMALLLPAVQSARETARRSQCRNNLKQLSLAVESFTSVAGHYPPNGWGFLWLGEPDRGIGKDQPGGWIYNILPYLERTDLHDAAKGRQPPERDAAMVDMMRTSVPILHCPNRGAGQLSPCLPRLVFRNAPWPPLVFKTDYAINEGDFITDTREGPSTLEEGDSGQYPWRDTRQASGISYLRSEVRPAHLHDGLSQTYMLGEKYVTRDNYSTCEDPGYDQSALSGVDVDLNRWVLAPPERDGDRTDMRIFGSPHFDACHMAFCDGSVRPISYTIDREVHRRLGNRHDRLPVGDDQF